MGVTVLKMFTAALVAGAAVPAMGLGAAIGLQDDQMQNFSATTVGQRISMMQATGTTVARVDNFWARTAPTRPADAAEHRDPAYDWSWSDAVFCGLLKAGIQPLVSTWNAPGWATGGAQGVKGVPWNSKAPRDPQDFADFMSALATRYNGVTMVPGQGTCLVKFHEIWNEPNLQIYLYPQYSGTRPVSPSTYVAMANLAVPAIKAANPRAVPITGVTGPKGRSDDAGRGTIDWINDLRRAGLRAGSQYSQHIYPAIAPLTRTSIFPAWDTLDEIVGAVNRLPGGRAKKIYITEASYTTAATRFRKVKFTVAQQAAYMRDIFRVPFTRSARVPLVVWFQLQDNENWPGGLLFANGGRKPAYRAFQRLAMTNPPKGNLRP